MAVFSSFAPITTETDVHLAFVFDGADTLIYENGVLVDTLFATALTLTDTVGIGGILNTAGPATNFDKMDGDIFGFVSYDSALSGAEVLAHSNAFAIVPEPSSTARPTAAVIITNEAPCTSSQ